MQPTIPAPTATQELLPPAVSIWPERTSSRLSGSFTLNLSDGQLTANWCPGPDGRIRDQVDNKGQPTGVLVMSSHIRQINSDGTMQVHGSDRLFSISSMFIKDHPVQSNIPAGLSNFERGDCVMIIGVQSPEPVAIYGVR